ncbi:MAG: hypothetical protein Q9197_002309, partial [Variospora fuerteventurae]
RLQEAAKFNEVIRNGRTTIGPQNINDANPYSTFDGLKQWLNDHDVSNGLSNLAPLEDRSLDLEILERVNSHGTKRVDNVMPSLENPLHWSCLYLIVKDCRVASPTDESIAKPGFLDCVQGAIRGLGSACDAIDKGMGYLPYNTPGVLSMKLGLEMLMNRYFARIVDIVGHAETDQEITKLKTVLKAFELGLQALINAVDRKRLPSTEEDVHDVMQAEFASLRTRRA